MGQKAARGPRRRERAKAPAKLPPSGRGGRRRRRHGGGPDRRATRGTDTLVASALRGLVTGITAAAERAVRFATAFGEGLPLDVVACEQYGREIQERFGVSVDCPELTEFVALCGWATRQLDHFHTLQRIGPDFAALLESQREKRRRFLAGHGYAATVRAVARYDRGPGTDDLTIAYERWEATGEQLIASFRNFPERPERQRPGPTRDLPLILTARDVAEWTKQHGRTGKASWTHTVMILLCHSVDLRALGSECEAARHGDRNAVRALAARLEDRVRHALPRS